MKVLIILVLILCLTLLSSCTWEEWEKTWTDPAWGTLGGGAPYTPTPAPDSSETGDTVVPSDEGL
jgi:hypothetical protein